MDVSISNLSVDINTVLPAAQHCKSKRPYTMNGNPVPTFLSECPYCGEPKKWATTGVIVPLKCKQCGGLFEMFKSE